jgi:hypothetical protein
MQSRCANFILGSVSKESLKDGRKGKVGYRFQWMVFQDISLFDRRYPG